MDDDKVILDKDTFKALAVDTRINILKLLLEKDRTGSQLAEELEMRPSTIKEHLDVLLHAKLIKQENTDRKWKFYSLTFKGRNVVNPKRREVLVGFFLSLMGVAVSTKLFFDKLVPSTKEFASTSFTKSAPLAENARLDESLEVVAAQDTELGLPRGAVEEDAADLAGEGATQLLEGAQQQIGELPPVMVQNVQDVVFPFGWLIAILIFLILATALGVIYFSKPKIIVAKKK